MGLACAIVWSSPIGEIGSQREDKLAHVFIHRVGRGPSHPALLGWEHLCLQATFILYLSLSLSIYPPTYLSTYLSDHLSVCHLYISMQQNTIQLLIRRETSFAKSWMNLEDVMLSKLSLMQGGKHLMILPICGIGANLMEIEEK